MINWVRVAGYGFISLSLLIFTLAIAILCAEFLGISSKILAQHGGSGDIPLHKTDYYGKPLEVDPYRQFTVQHLHPYYLFSLPWQENDRSAANNDLVHVDEDGFRVNPLLKSRKKLGVLLGGSSAFGHFATSDETTLAAVLTKQSGLGFINRNAPSWNSHQELVALIKFAGRYEVSISFSLANDIEIFCKNLQKKLPIKDAPESFRQLNSLVNDIRGKPRKRWERAWEVIGELFPDTLRLYTLYMDQWPHTIKETKTERYSFCAGQEDNLIVTFLRNQIAMRQISNARGGRHFLVIQPQYSLHVTSTYQHRRDTDAAVTFKRRVIRKIAESDFCRIDCLDLSKAFDEAGGVTLVSDVGLADPREAVLVDEVHLTDLGIIRVAAKIWEELKRFELVVGRNAGSEVAP